MLRAIAFAVTRNSPATRIIEQQSAGLPWARVDAFEEGGL